MNTANATDNKLTDEQTLALDFLLRHKKDFTQRFLHARGLASFVPKEKLRERLVEYVAADGIHFDDLVTFLNGSIWDSGS